MGSRKGIIMLYCSPIMKLVNFRKISLFLSLWLAFLAMPALANDDQTPVRAEPIIRVGIYKTQGPVKIESTFDYTVYSGNVEQGILPAQTSAILTYKKGVYTFKSEAIDFEVKEQIRLVPVSRGNYLTITNLDRRLKGRKGNFNAYQGVIEYRFSPKSGLPYIINELPLEDYVAGIGEVNNSDPYEYIKAMIVAARTYGFLHIAPTTKNHLFDVYGSTQDQLYLGYNSSLHLPKVVKTAEETAGEMVTFQGRPVMTYYFGHSDGRTRGVSNQSQPWLRSVPAPYDKGKTLWGHGIGMSCNDALQHAKKEGWKYDQILRYYYTGTMVEKVY